MDQTICAVIYTHALFSSSVWNLKFIKPQEFVIEWSSFLRYGVSGHTVLA